MVFDYVSPERKTLLFLNVTLLFQVFLVQIQVLLVMFLMLKFKSLDHLFNPYAFCTDTKSLQNFLANHLLIFPIQS